MANFPQRHPLAALLLLLALLPALIGGSLTHTCGCRGLVYVGGCACYSGESEGAAPKVSGNSLPDARSEASRSGASSALACACNAAKGSAVCRGSEARGCASSSSGDSSDEDAPSDVSGHSCDSLALEMEHPSLLRNLPPPPEAAILPELTRLPSCELAPWSAPTRPRPPCPLPTEAGLSLPLLI